MFAKFPEMGVPGRFRKCQANVLESTVLKDSSFSASIFPIFLSGMPSRSTTRISMVRDYRSDITRCFHFLSPASHSLREILWLAA